MPAFRYYAFDPDGVLLHSYEVTGECQHDALSSAHDGYDGWPSPAIASEFVVPMDTMSIEQEETQEPLEAA